MKLLPFQAAIQVSAAAMLPAVVSAVSNDSKSKHRHMHLHRHGHGSSSHVDKPIDSHTDSPAADSHADSYTEEDTAGEELRRRQTDGVAITHVTRTLSVVQVIDGQGSVVTLSTMPAPFITQTDATVTGTTPVSSDPLPASTPTRSGSTAAAGTFGPTETSATMSGATTGTSLSPVASDATPSAGAASTAATTAATTTAAAAAAQGSSVFVNGTLTTAPIPLTTGASPTRLFGNGTTSTSHSLFANHTQTSSSTLSSYASSSSLSLSSSAASSYGYSTSLYTSVTSSFSAAAGEATGGADSTVSAGGAGGGSTATDSGAGTAPTSSSNDDDSSSTPTSVLVGSVIGGLAGVALLLVIALYLLKWKRKKGDGNHRLLTEGDDAAGTAGTAKSLGGPTGPGGFSGLGALGLNQGMTEARGGFLAPFASALASGQRRMSRAAETTVRPLITAPGAAMGNSASAQAATAGGDLETAAIAASAVPVAGAGNCSPISEKANAGNMTPTNPSSPVVPSEGTPSPATERSFYRVSGRKLPSVLQHGGDGYDDPRQSVMSTNTINTSYTHMSMHRDSRGFFGGAGGPATTPTSRYAVGSPMRPESGVPVFHTGPGKMVSPLRAPVSRQGSVLHDDGASVSGSGGNLTPPPGLGHLDPIGRSLISQDGSRGSRGSVSRGSVSRFTEDIP